MSRRANNEGSIYRRKSDNKWTASITLDDGKRKVFYGKTQKEVKDKLAKAKNEQQQGVLLASAQMKLSVYIESWLESYKRTVRPNTHQRACEIYSGPVCQVQKSVFGKIPLSPFQWRLEIRREV